MKETIKNFKLTWKFIQNKKKSIILMTILSIISSIVGVIIPLLTAKIILNMSNGIIDELLKVVIFFFMVEITRNTLHFLYDKLSDMFFLEVSTNIQLEMYKETLEIETSEIDKNSTGLFIERIKDDTNSIINIFTVLSDQIVELISNIGVIIAVYCISKPMFIYFIINALLSYLITKKRRDVYYKKYEKVRSNKEKRTSLTSEVIRGIRDVKLLNAKGGMLNKIKNQISIINKETIKLEKIDRNYDFLYRNIDDFLDIIFFILGIYLLSISNITCSSFVILYNYKDNVSRVLNIFDRLIDHLKDYNISANKINEILENKFKKERKTGINLKLNGDIEFKNVTFKYTDTDVLNNISFKINKGERVGFVGTSGSGKTTIFNLITKLYSGEDGEILFDNINSNDISISSIRDNISLIPQNPYIFNFSIKDNIKLANNNVSIDDINNAIKEADLYDKVNSLDNKLDTILGEGGVILSGGEKQRLAIARCLIKNSNIILFDEATSSLDNISQEKIQNAIYGMDKTKTILIIAHRLSTIINCDKIIVLDKGCIIDIGTHKELLERCEKYKELYKYEK